MNNSKHIKKIIDDCIRWFEEVQIKDDPFHRGGFPPYPKNIKSAGTLATADVITFLRRAGIDKKPLIDDGTEFLLRVQIKDSKEYLSQNGGFPPIGDFEFITNTAFTDSTADAILALLSVYPRMIQEIKDAETDEQKRYLEQELKNISNSIDGAIEWLLRCFDKTNNVLPTYLIGEENIVGEKRYFPTMLAGIAFLTYIDYCNEIGIQVRHERNINIIVDKLVNDTRNMLLGKGYISFNVEKDKPSFTNTMLAIEFLYIYFKNVEDKNAYEEALTKAYQWLLEGFGNIIKKGEKEITDAFTDFDKVHIDIPEIAEGIYPATYFTLAPMVKLLIEYPPHDLAYQEMLYTLIEQLLNIVDSSNNYEFYWEYRGRKEPATSATASAIYALSVYMRSLEKKEVTQ